MVGSKYFAFAAAALVSVASASAVEGDWVLALLKRQAPGTPAYACHEACGNSITLSRGASPCTDDTFLSSYTSCLACAGPDNQNIWRYYGATLSVAGGRCGLSTTPASGGGSSSSTTSAAPVSSSTTAAPTTTAPTSSTTTSAPAAGSTTVSSSTSTSASPAASSTSSAGSSASASGTAAASATSSSAVVVSVPTVAPSGTRPAGNGTATSTSAQFTGAANSQQIFGLSAVGAAVLAFLV